MKATKKPIEIEAVRYIGTTEDDVGVFSVHFEEGADWIADAVEDGSLYPQGSFTQLSAISSPTHGELTLNPGDYIIRGVEGELYPCSPSIFEATYDVHS